MLVSLKDAGYTFTRFAEYYDLQKSEKTAFLRHDIDARPTNALKTAIIESSHGIVGTYYFRTIESVFVPDIISEIASMGHEIGYHYENMDDANGDVVLAILDFERNLSMLREITEISTICMHGSPLSKWSNLELWNSYSYKEFNIRLEAFKDVDYHDSVYLTDTGRSWRHNIANMRDRVKTNVVFDIRSTTELISRIVDLPNHVFITIHPQRWDDSYYPWVRELISQRIKNILKTGLRMYRRM